VAETPLNSTFKAATAATLFPSRSEDMQIAESLWHKPLRALKLTEDKTVPAGARGELLHNLLGQQEKLLMAFKQLQADRRAADGEDGEDEAERQEIMQLWSFGSNQRVTYLLKRKRSGDGEVEDHYQVANFAMHAADLGVRAQYYFDPTEHRGIIYSQRLSFTPDWATPGGPLLYWNGETVDEVRSYGRFIIDVEVDFATLNVRADVNRLYSSATPFGLVCQLEPAQLLCLLQSLDAPPPCRALSYLGRQQGPLACYFVAGNGAVYHDAETGLSRFVSHEEAGVKLVPAALQACFVKYTPTHYPHVVDLPQTHVRFDMFHLLWSGSDSLIDQYFGNNATQTRLMFAFMAMTIHVQDLWEGHIPGIKGPPCLYAYSPEAGTGKSTGAVLARSMLGQRTPVLAPSSCSEAGLFEWINVGRGGNMCLDDLVNDPATQQLFSKLIRAYYDQTDRSVIGKDRLPTNSLLITTNDDISVGDVPLRTRLAHVPFNKPDTKPDPTTCSDYQAALGVLSALFPDIDSITRYNGSLDVDAVVECCTFVELAVDKTLGTAHAPSRNLVFWGLMLYLVMLLTVAAHAFASELLPLISFCVEQAAQSAYLERLAASPLLDFLIHLAQVMPNGPGPQRAASQGQAQDCVHFHNLVVADYPVHGGTWYAVHLHSIGQPIFAQLGKRFDTQKIGQCVRDLPEGDRLRGNLMIGKALFYCIRKGAWPPVFCPEASERIPMTQAQALDMAKVEKEGVLWIRKQYFDELIERHFTPIKVSSQLLSSILIPPCTATDTRSRDPEQTSAYSLVQLLKDTPSHELATLWLFRALRQSNFADYCGASNFCNPTQFDTGDVLEETKRFMREEHDKDIPNLECMFTLPMFSFFYTNDVPLPPCYLQHAYAFLRSPPPPLPSEQAPANGPLSPAASTVSRIPETPCDIPGSNVSAAATEPAAVPDSEPPRQPSRPSRQRSSPAKFIEPPVAKKHNSGRDLSSIFAAAGAGGDDKQTERLGTSAGDRTVTGSDPEQVALP